MLSWASPVPGGMSMTMTSRAPQLTLVMKVSIALITMGPRHTAALSSCVNTAASLSTLCACVSPMRGVHQVLVRIEL